MPTEDSTESKPDRRLAPEILAHYGDGREATRLSSPCGELEFVRSQEIIERHLPSPPATVLDVGGGPGAYALWLLEKGYEVHLIDPMPLHVEQAQAGFAGLPAGRSATARVGDARALDHPDAGADAALLLGPLYHLTERADRLAALREARRVVRPGGPVFVAGISRFASLLDGLFWGMIDDPQFVEIVEADLREGQHRNPGDHPDYFTTAFLHHPDELRAEVEEAGFTVGGFFAIEGPAWLLPNLPDRWSDGFRRGQLLGFLRKIERDESLIGASAHLMVVGRAD